MIRLIGLLLSPLFTVLSSLGGLIATLAVIAAVTLMWVFVYNWFVAVLTIPFIVALLAIWLLASTHRR